MRDLGKHSRDESTVATQIPFADCKCSQSVRGRPRGHRCFRDFQRSLRFDGQLPDVQRKAPLASCRTISLLPRWRGLHLATPGYVERNYAYQSARVNAGAFGQLRHENQWKNNEHPKWKPPTQIAFFFVGRSADAPLREVVMHSLFSAYRIRASSRT